MAWLRHDFTDVEPLVSMLKPYPDVMRHALNDLGFVYLGCILILLPQCL